MMCAVPPGMSLPLMSTINHVYGERPYFICVEPLSLLRFMGQCDVLSLNLIRSRKQQLIFDAATCQGIFVNLCSPPFTFIP